MTTERLYEFLILSQTLSFSKAAKKLFMSQSTLSRHITELERELDIELLTRTTQSVCLTEAGKLLMRSASDILHQFDTANSRLHISGIQASGCVSVLCADTAVCPSLNDFLHLFSEKYSEISLQIEITSMPEAPAPGAVDFVFTPFEYGAIAAKNVPMLVFTEAAYLAIPVNHRLLGGRQIELSELSGETLIVPFGNEVLCSFASNRQLAERYTNNQLDILHTTNIKTALLLVSLGRGVSIIPQYLAKNSVCDTKIVGITTKECKFEIFEYWDEARDNPAAKLFQEELINYIKRSCSAE
ncbi:MAG: LysR family transcriptional regulator [Clostridiaceae bacterium]|jgi:DNA-binding transcriptional LysR family regulator|nr:LysR family transcriptional regulator [Clostridiaceae bacterium]